MCNTIKIKLKLRSGERGIKIKVKIRDYLTCDWYGLRSQLIPSGASISA